MGTRRSGKWKKLVSSFSWRLGIEVNNIIKGEHDFMIASAAVCPLKDGER